MKSQCQLNEPHSLDPFQVKALLDEAKKESLFDYVALETMILLQLRRGALVGQNDPRSEPNPGMLIENLTPEGIRLNERGTAEKVFKPISSELRGKVDQIVGTRKSGPIFPRTTGWVWYRIIHYAKKAGIPFKVNANMLYDFSETYKPFLPTVIKNPSFLDQSSEEREKIERETRAQEPEKTRTPRQVMDNAFRNLNTSLSDDILARLKKGSPRFFENTILDLLVKMGYGSRENAKVTGRTRDGGIDGVVAQDKLGLLPPIGWQAKRWDSSVGSPVVRDFVGSLDGIHAKVGILFTTSQFTQDAEDWSKKPEKNVKLINGKMLATLMIDHDVGVVEDEKYILKKVDKDYFK